VRLEAGTPAEVILTAAERERIDLIVMGVRGVGLLREAMLGSVSRRVITHATCPTLAVAAPMRSWRRFSWRSRLKRTRKQRSTYSPNDLFAMHQIWRS